MHKRVDIKATPAAGVTACQRQTPSNSMLARDATHPNFSRLEDFKKNCGKSPNWENTYLYSIKLDTFHSVLYGYQFENFPKIKA